MGSRKTQKINRLESEELLRSSLNFEDVFVKGDGKRKLTQCFHKI